MKHRFLFFAVMSSTLLIVSCEEPEQYTPKPLGYMRVELPEHEYEAYDSDCPYTFEYPAGSVFTSPIDSAPCAQSMKIPAINADLFLDYQPLDSNLAEKVRQAHRAIMFNEVRADAINRSFIHHNDRKVHGNFYTLTGNSATPFQFFLTDSTDHFLKGTFMFYTKPNYDSLRPYIDHVEQDLEHLIETFEWK